MSSSKPKNPEQSNNPDDYHDPGRVTPEELAAHDAAQQQARIAADQVAKDTEKKEAEGGPADTGPDKSDGSQEPAFETNTPSKAPKSSFRQKMFDTIESEIDIIKASLGTARGVGTEKQQENYFKWVELGVKLSNDEE